MKKTKKEIEETLRCKLQRKFNEEMENSRERYANLAKENRELRAKLNEKNEELISMKDKVDQYEDWIRRLQEFCNLPDGEREKAVKAFKAENERKYHVNALFNSPLIKMYTEMFNLGF